jgi:hypothetical protein
MRAGQLLGQSQPEAQRDHAPRIGRPRPHWHTGVRLHPRLDFRERRFLRIRELNAKRGEVLKSIILHSDYALYSPLPSDKAAPQHRANYRRSMSGDGLSASGSGATRARA